MTQYSGFDASGNPVGGWNGSDLTDDEWRQIGVKIPSTSGSGNKSSSESKKKDTSDSLAKQQEKLRNSLSKSFNPTIDAYKQMIGWLPEEQGNLEEQVNTLANTQKTSINDALNAALEKYTGYRGEVETNQKKTLQDLSDNTRNLFQAGNNYLGARGAGNSSATGMYGAALTQQANKQRSDIKGQSNSMYNDINMQEADTRSQSQQQLDAVETWKATRVTEIVQQYQDLKRQLTLAKAQADSAKKAALAQLDASLFESAVNKLNSIQSIASQYKSNVASAMEQQNAGMQEKLTGIKNSAQYDVQDLQRIPLEGIEQGQSMTDGTIVGYYQGRKVQTDQEGNILAFLD